MDSLTTKPALVADQLVPLRRNASVDLGQDISPFPAANQPTGQPLWSLCLS